MNWLQRLFSSTPKRATTPENPPAPAARPVPPPSLMVAMLSSYREAAREMFASRMRSTQIEHGRWVCFVSGQITTLSALYNTEPAARQLQLMEETHLFFERANKPRLQQSPINIDGRIFPHEYYLQ
jgi:hypothetical protein